MKYKISILSDILAQYRGASWHYARVRSLFDSLVNSRIGAETPMSNAISECVKVSEARRVAEESVTLHLAKLLPDIAHTWQYDTNVGAIVITTDVEAGLPNAFEPLPEPLAIDEGTATRQAISPIDRETAEKYSVLLLQKNEIKSLIDSLRTTNNPSAQASLTELTRRYDAICAEYYPIQYKMMAEARQNLQGGFSRNIVSVELPIGSYIANVTLKVTDTGDETEGEPLQFAGEGTDGDGE